MEYARLVDFKDKHGEPLLSWNDENGAFEAWKKMSLGRPCHYTGMTYEKLTGGSGIQWPCDEKARKEQRDCLPMVCVLQTSNTVCDSYGHDLETGPPLTKLEFEILNPRG